MRSATVSIPAPTRAAELPASAASSPSMAVVAAIAVLRQRSAMDRHPLDLEESRALGVVYVAYAEMMRAVARRFLGDVDDATDVVHDVFVRLPNLVRQYGSGGFGGWLRQIVAREALMHMRRAQGQRGRMMTDADGLAAASAHDSRLDGLADADEVRWALSRLPAPMREVVVLRVFVGLAHDEIGRELEISSTASEVRLCRALKQLRWMIRRGAVPSPERVHARRAS